LRDSNPRPLAPEAGDASVNRTLFRAVEYAAGMMGAKPARRAPPRTLGLASRRACSPSHARAAAALLTGGADPTARPTIQLIGIGTDASTAAAQRRAEPGACAVGGPAVAPETSPCEVDQRASHAVHRAVVVERQAGDALAGAGVAARESRIGTLVIAGARV